MDPVRGFHPHCLDVSRGFDAGHGLAFQFGGGSLEARVAVMIEQSEQLGLGHRWQNARADGAF